MKPLIIPVPFAVSQYGQSATNTYKRILNNTSASPVMEKFNPSALLLNNCQLLEPIKFDKFIDKQNTMTPFLESAVDMQQNLASSIQNNLNPKSKTLVLGGDHTISVGTGLGISRLLDMNKVGLIYVDAHGDCNTPDSSQSKCLTGYPVAVNFGLGHKELVEPFNQNYLHKVAYIGVRDIDEGEEKILHHISAKIFSNIDVELQGITQVLYSTMDYLSDCNYIWLSIDVDSLDSVYLQTGETDVPSSGGLTPREILAITKFVSDSKKHFFDRNNSIK
ncbi:MAG: hypothetical protein HC932_01315 [Thermales bacterium]|nr:hypothetical protein [Thermales bacterium]